MIAMTESVNMGKGGNSIGHQRIGGGWLNVRIMRESICLQFGGGDLVRDIVHCPIRGGRLHIAFRGEESII